MILRSLATTNDDVVASLEMVFVYFVFFDVQRQYKQLMYNSRKFVFFDVMNNPTMKGNLALHTHIFLKSFIKSAN